MFLAIVNGLCCRLLRHVLLPKEIAKLVPKKHLMSEAEWRSLGVQQSQGWEHYMKHEPGKYNYLLIFSKRKKKISVFTEVHGSSDLLNESCSKVQFDCLVFEMLYIKRPKPNLNVQTN